MQCLRYSKLSFVRLSASPNYENENLITTYCIQGLYKQQQCSKICLKHLQTFSLKIGVEEHLREVCILEELPPEIMLLCICSITPLTTSKCVKDKISLGLKKLFFYILIDQYSTNARHFVSNCLYNKETINC